MDLQSFVSDLIGNPYKYGALPEEAPNCFDCASLVQYIYSKFYKIELPRTSLEQAADVRGLFIDYKDENDLSVGDLIFSEGTKGRYDSSLFNGNKILIGHVCIYIGNKSTISARRSKGGVTYQSLEELRTDPSLGGANLVKRFII